MAAAGSTPACASKIYIMKLREKIAMSWTFPIMFVVLILLAVLASLLHFIAYALNVSGTTGATIYIFDQLKNKIIDRRLRKLVKEDEKLHKFDS